MFQTLYKKCLDLAAHKSSNFYLGLVSFTESSFFPIPPDAMIIPMVIAKKEKYLKIFLIASIFSVLGGIFGYLIGYLFFDLAMYVIEFYGYQDKVENLKLSMSQGSGFLAWLSILFLAGFTPLPYKAFTISSGLIAFNLPVFIIVSLISNFQLYLDNHKIRLHILLNQKINNLSNIQKFLQELKILMLSKIFSNIPFF